MPPKLREHLNLEGSAGNRTWKDLRDYIDKTTRDHIDLSKGTVTYRHHKAALELIAEKVCTAFESLFSNAESTSQSRILLEKYIVSNGNDIRRRDELEKEKIIRNRPATRGFLSQMPVDTRQANQSNPVLAVEGYDSSIRARTTDDRHPRMQVADPRIPVGRPRALSQDSLYYPPFKDDSSGPPYYQGGQKTRAEHEELHNFLASCRPCLTHLYVYLVAYGCIDMDYLKVMSESADTDLESVLKNMKAMVIEDGGAKPVKPMDWDVFRHYIRKLK